MNTQLRNIKIAQFLNLPSSYSIRRVEEWNTVYFVVPVVGRPTFVSKAAIDSQPSVVVSLDSINLDTLKCRVLAVTKPRQNRFAGTLNVGVLLMDIDSREKFWINHYRYQQKPVYRGDVVIYDCKYRAIDQVLHGSRRALQSL